MATSEEMEDAREVLRLAARSLPPSEAVLDLLDIGVRLSLPSSLLLDFVWHVRRSIVQFSTRGFSSCLLIALPEQSSLEDDCILICRPSR